MKSSMFFLVAFVSVTQFAFAAGSDKNQGNVTPECTAAYAKLDALEEEFKTARCDDEKEYKGTVCQAIVQKTDAIYEAAPSCDQDSND